MAAGLTGFVALGVVAAASIAFFSANAQQVDMEASAEVAKAAGRDVAAPEAAFEPIDLSDMELHNWSGKWHASHWTNHFSTIPFRYDKVEQQENGDTLFIFDEDGAPELKAQGGHPYSTKAYYEVDVTIPELRSGLVVAPLWLWHDHTKDEIDFEFVGDRYLQVTVHSYRSGEHVSQAHKMTGDFSGKRMKLAIATDLEAGEIDMIVDGRVVHTFYNDSEAFPTGAMRPVISMWVGDNVNWAEPWTGPWEGFAEDEQIVMTIHGYRFEQREEEKPAEEAASSES